MKIIYFDYIAGFGINAFIADELDFFPSFDELIHYCIALYGDQIVLVSTTVTSGISTGYQESSK
ncbi:MULTISPECIES: hypothetical protein [Xenorhabdus]|uniref:Uncharacterized protein n=2 Tax=Xenorhabdus TaxID=626 RepID=A0A2D0IR06_9GAMM|nr:MULTISPECIES: hypothetical protein [Xenorhabdus]OKP03317.1 hypothetical protein Xedl_01914 [Xenorhabdus eapokensis]PHM24260.1 hypothetical protein Xehl_02310 [Xenorhabdus ehlersii]RKE91178.1 hypothetical protein BDE27_1383 [Xenorhabdus ehlersii]